MKNELTYNIIQISNLMKRLPMVSISGIVMGILEADKQIGEIPAGIKISGTMLGIMCHLIIIYCGKSILSDSIRGIEEAENLNISVKVTGREGSEGKEEEEETTAIAVASPLSAGQPILPGYLSQQHNLQSIQPVQSVVRHLVA